jgi:peptidoglycan hydrolase-like protein with peptidoglycan-binding domain
MLDPRTVQRAVAAAGLYRGPIDGILGRGSRGGIRALADARAPAYRTAWTDARCLLAVEQAIMADAGFYKATIDGVDGPVTQTALERWQDFVTFDRPSPNPTAGVAQAVSWPRAAEMEKFYGKPGTNHTRIDPPYPVFYGDKQVETILINERCAESALRILDGVLDYYGAARIHALGLDRFGGCFNNRTMRNGSRLSTHAFAAAWDWDAARNPLRATSRTAQMAKPDYAAFIDAHEAEGWISLGRARNFDWMHFQAARL